MAYFTTDVADAFTFRHAPGNLRLQFIFVVPHHTSNKIKYGVESNTPAQKIKFHWILPFFNFPIENTITVKI